MIKFRILFLMLFLIIPTLASAQTKAAANKSWAKFWSQFSTAMNKKDRRALKALMSPDFEWAYSGHISPEEVFQIMDEGKHWKSFQKSVANGVKICGYEATDCLNTTNIARRTKSPEWLLFEFIGGRWKWTRLLGD